MNPGARNADGDAIGDGHPALEDVQVRRAIAMAIDPEVLVDKVLGGYGELPGGLVPPIYEDYHYVPDEDVRYSLIRTRRTRCWTRRGTGGARTGSGWTRKAGGWSSG